MSGSSSISSSGSNLECQVCNWRIAERNHNICLACLKFLSRIRGKPIAQCRSGTNDCQVATRRAALFCQQCRLQRCLTATDASTSSCFDGTTSKCCQSSSMSNNSSTSDGANSIVHDPLEEGAEEAIENFEITWVDWLSVGNRECLARMISETVYQFSQRIPNFSKLSSNIQLMLNFQATPLLCLILALASHFEDLNVDFIYQLFPGLKSYGRDDKILPEKFNKWQPSLLETGCLMAVTMFRNCGENDDISIGNVLRAIDTSLAAINESDRKAHFIDILSSILPTSNYFMSRKGRCLTAN